MTDAMNAIAKLSGQTLRSAPAACTWPTSIISAASRPSSSPIAHDDGRNPQEMSQADIVLLGVSRCVEDAHPSPGTAGATKVSNILLDPSTEPPKGGVRGGSHAPVRPDDHRRRFFLVGIRQRRLGNAAVAASQYADPEYVYEDLERARTLMRKLGPSSFTPKIAPLKKPLKEILRYYERAHPQGADIVIRS